MKTAFISDIHGNSSALLTVLDDIKSRNVHRIVCLGDMVDAGDDNDYIVEYMRNNHIITVQGNHDIINDCKLEKDNQKWLYELPEMIIEDDIWFTRISPRQQKYQIYNNIEAWNVFDKHNFRLCFIGHLHFPVLFGEKYDFFGESCKYVVDEGELILDGIDLPKILFNFLDNFGIIIPNTQYPIPHFLTH